MKEKQIILYINFEISKPQIPQNINKNIILSSNLKLNYISFCSNQNNGICIPSQSSSFKITWGSAFYKNLRLWDSMSSTIESIQKYDRSNELLYGLLLYYPMTIDKITYNTIQNVIDHSNNIIVSIIKVLILIQMMVIFFIIMELILIGMKNQFKIMVIILQK